MAVYLFDAKFLLPDSLFCLFLLGLKMLFGFLIAGSTSISVSCKICKCRGWTELPWNYMPYAQIHNYMSIHNVSSMLNSDMCWHWLFSLYVHHFHWALNILNAFVYCHSSSACGVILPQVVTAGTVTRRAVEPTWLTASNPLVSICFETHSFFLLRIS